MIASPQNFANSDDLASFSRNILELDAQSMLDRIAAQKAELDKQIRELEKQDHEIGVWMELYIVKRPHGKTYEYYRLRWRDSVRKQKAQHIPWREVGRYKTAIARGQEIMRCYRQMDQLEKLTRKLESKILGLATALESLPQNPEVQL